MFAIFIVLLILFKKKSGYSEPLPKIVWILWLQGWDKAPWVSKKVAESWKKMNPGWEIKMIDRENCPVEIYGDTPQAESDVIRLGLMFKYGGVWADSTLLCMQSLDDWVHEATEPTGYWMYRGWYSRPASWFFVFKPGHYVLEKWVESCKKYWETGGTSKNNYNWMDNLLKPLLETDPKIKESWDKVPYLSSEDEGQAGMLSGKVAEDSPELKQILKSRPPRVLKLDKSAIDENSVNSNGYYAIQLTS